MRLHLSNAFNKKRTFDKADLFYVELWFEPKKVKNSPSLQYRRTGTFQMKGCEIKLKTYFLSGHKSKLQNAIFLKRVFNRIFNEIQIEIFASRYAVQVSYLNVAKLFPIRGSSIGLTPGIKFPNESRYGASK